MKPRKKVRPQNWKSRPYNIGVFDEANNRKNKQRKIRRKTMENVALPESEVKYDMDAVKVRLEKMKKRKKPKKKKKEEKKSKEQKSEEQKMYLMIVTGHHLMMNQYLHQRY